MNRTNRNLTLILILQVTIIQILKSSPDFIETYYAQRVYPVIGRLLRFLFGGLSFSVGDILYLSIGLYFLYLVFRMLKTSSERKATLWKIGALFSIVYFVFYSFWGLNYFRLPVDNRMGLKSGKPQVEALEKLGDQLLERVKQNHFLLTGNDTLKTEVKIKTSELLLQSPKGYFELSKKFPEFKYERASIKASLFSLPLTYMGFSGYLNPFTGEAQVDDLVPKVALPLITSHEIAHQLGIASENEANFIGFLAAIYHKDPLFRYSAYLMALRYVISDLKRTDSGKAEELIKNLPKGVRKDIREMDNFWKSYRNFSEKYFKFFYDNYLKANKQKQGIKSYSRVTDLILAFTEKNTLP